MPEPMRALTANARLTCTLADDIDVWGRSAPGPLRPCGASAIALLIFGCLHEHVDRAMGCVPCVAELQRVDDVLICRHCETGSQPHECPVVMKIEWLGEEVRNAQEPVCR
jgi:hypothetical protein